MPYCMYQSYYEKTDNSRFSHHNNTKSYLRWAFFPFTYHLHPPLYVFLSHRFTHRSNPSASPTPTLTPTINNYHNGSCPRSKPPSRQQLSPTTQRPSTISTIIQQQPQPFISPEQCLKPVCIKSIYPITIHPANASPKHHYPLITTRHHIQYEPRRPRRNLNVQQLERASHEAPRAGRYQHISRPQRQPHEPRRTKRY